MTSDCITVLLIWRTSVAAPSDVLHFSSHKTCGTAELMEISCHRRKLLLLFLFSSHFALIINLPSELCLILVTEIVGICVFGVSGDSAAAAVLHEEACSSDHRFVPCGQ